MQALHIVLLATTAMAFVVAATPGSRVGTGREHGRLITLVVSGAAVVGNAASLMPGTPAWYGRFMVVITFAAVAWALVAVAARRAQQRAQAQRARAERVVVVRRRRVASVPETHATARTASSSAARAASHDTARPSPAATSAPRPNLCVVADTDQADIVDAEIVEDEPNGEACAGRDAPSGRPALTLATQATFDEYGPSRASRLRGETYVAAHLEDYLPDTRHDLTRRRARLRAEHTDLRARLSAAYGLQAPERGSVASYRA